MTLMFVAATGGHLSQLAALESRIDESDGERIWVTFDSPQSRSLLADKKVEYIPAVEERDFVGSLRALGTAKMLLNKHQPRAIFSTGSAVAVPFLTMATLRRIPAHYIESAARVTDISMTARLLSWNPKVKLYRQYDFEMRDGWNYPGSVFDAFISAQANGTARHSAKRFVVTFGTGVHPFGRLLANLLAILPVNAEVLWQTGSTPIKGLGIDGRAQVPAAELNEAIAAADVVIGHAGCGTALTALTAGKVPILAPRCKSFGELVDDHQVAVAHWLDKRGLALCRQAGSITRDDLTLAASLQVKQNPSPFPLRLS